MKVYNIHGSKWYMEELTFEEDFKLTKILKEKLPDYQVEGFDGVKIVESLYSSGVLAEVFQLILKPYEPTIFHRLSNDYYIWKNGLKRGMIIEKMKNSEIASIVADFFDVNVNWMATYFSFTEKSGLNFQTIPILKDLVSLNNPFLQSQTAT